MGSEFCTYKEAAERIGVKQRTIYNYVASGRIRKERKDGKVVLRSEDVEQEAAAHQETMVPFNRRTFMEMRKEIEALKRGFAFIQRQVDTTPINPFRPDKAIAEGFVRDAAFTLGVDRPPLAMVEHWAGLFPRFDEVALTMLVTHTGDREAWAPIFKVCMRLMEYVSIQPEFPTSLVLQAMHQKLDEGRRVMRGTIVMWAALNRGNVPEFVFRETASQKERLLAKL